MSYTIDRRLVRHVGNLLAGGSGTFTVSDVRRMFNEADADGRLLASESAAMLVLCVVVCDLCDEDAAALLMQLIAAAREDDPGLERWLGKSLSTSVLQHAGRLIAGRGSRKVTRDEVAGLVRDAYYGGKPGPAISADESLALQVARELLHGRLQPDAGTLLDELFAAPAVGGHSSGSASGAGGHAASGSAGRQCGHCSGSGSVSCSACGGYGFHQQSGTRTGWDGSPEYYDERVPCGCSGGYRTCGTCGGSGRV